MLKSINDVNAPKFLAPDIPLFLGILQDLFPGIDKPNLDMEQLIDAVKTNAESMNLVATDNFVEKILQLYNMILVRHGLMIVGYPYGAKTKAYKVL